MSGVRSEPAEVWLNDGRPGRFIWRGRLYTVLSVTERPDRDAAAESAPGGAEGPTGAADETRRLPMTDHEHSHEHSAHRRGRLAAGWECWRVTASPGKSVPADAYRLCHDMAADRWFLSRDAGH